LVRPDLQRLLIAEVRRPATALAPLNLLIQRLTQYGQEFVKRNNTRRHCIQELVVDSRQVGIGILAAPAFQHGSVRFREGIEPRGTDVIRDELRSARSDFTKHAISDDGVWCHIPGSRAAQRAHVPRLGGIDQPSQLGIRLREYPSYFFRRLPRESLRVARWRPCRHNRTPQA